MFRSMVRALGLLVIIGSIVGCNISAEDSIAPPKKISPFMDSRKTITGPNLTGLWQSTCTIQSTSNSYRVFTLKIEKDRLTRSERYYADAECAELVEDQTYKGLYRFVEKYKDGSYELEYVFQVSKNLRINPLEKWDLREDILYISDMVTGNAAPVVETEPLFRDGIDPRGIVLEEGFYISDQGHRYEVKMFEDDEGQLLMEIRKQGLSLSLLGCGKHRCEGQSMHGNSVEVQLVSSTHWIYYDANEGLGINLKLE